MTAETSVDMLHGEKTAIWYSSHPATIRKMKKLKEEYPDEVRVIIDHTEGLSMGNDGEDDDDAEENVGYDRDMLSYEIECPKRWFRMPKPPAKREMTEEHKEKIQKALKEYRESKKK